MTVDAAEGPLAVADVPMQIVEPAQVDADVPRPPFDAAREELAPPPKMQRLSCIKTSPPGASDSAASVVAAEIVAQQTQQTP